MTNPRTVLITGTTSGLGKALASELGTRGWTVLVHGRDVVKLDSVTAGLRSKGLDAHPYTADLSSLTETAELGARVAKDHPSLQLLINNAGVGSGPPRGRREVSADGYELRFAVNYLAPVVLTRALLPALRAGAPAHVVNIGSVGMSDIDYADPQFEKRYEGMEAYTRSKYALNVFTADLAGQLEPDGIRVNCIHPATYMDTGMVRESKVTPWTSVGTGVRAVIALIDSHGVTGAFFDGTRESGGRRSSRNQQAADRLATLTAGLTSAVLER